MVCLSPSSRKLINHTEIPPPSSPKNCSLQATKNLGLCQPATISAVRFALPHYPTPQCLQTRTHVQRRSTKNFAGLSPFCCRCPIVEIICSAADGLFDLTKPPPHARKTGVTMPLLRKTGKKSDYAEGTRRFGTTPLRDSIKRNYRSL